MALGIGEPARKPRPAAGLDVWRLLANWEEPPPATPPGMRTGRAARGAAVGSPDGVRAGPQHRRGATDPERLRLGPRSEAFAPREEEDKPKVVLVEAAPAVGKTLGYVAPASLWAEKNGAPVLDRHLYNPQPAAPDRQLSSTACIATLPKRGRRVVIRKGRENYLCLLNFQEAVMRTGLLPVEPPSASGLLARWRSWQSRDGDMIRRRPAGLAARPAWAAGPASRGSPTGAASASIRPAEHYRKCFVERTIRRARTADIVIANHALVMVQAAMGGLDDATRPTRYVFDEGHHIFDAADAAFGAHLSASNARTLRADPRRPRVAAAEPRPRAGSGASRDLWARNVVGAECRAPAPARSPRAACPRHPWQTRLADGTGDGPGRGVPGAGAPAGPRPRRRRGPGLRPG